MKKTNIDELTNSINKLLKRKIELQQELATVSKQLIIENNKLSKLITGGTKSGPAKGKTKRVQSVSVRKRNNELSKLTDSLNKLTNQLENEAKQIDKQFASLEKLEKLK